MAAALLRLRWRAFSLALPQPLVTARGVLRRKRGWLLRLEAGEGDGGGDGAGAVGWGEAAPLTGDLDPLERAMARLGPQCHRDDLEARLPALPPALAFAIGAALAERDGLPRGRWLPPPPSARLLPAGEAALAALARDGAGGPAAPAVFKWKVAVAPERQERQWLEALVQQLPAGARLRLDANGGWDRPTAWRWAERLAGEPRLAWLEQPLPAGDAAGMAALAAAFPALPLALDEALQANPALRRRWPGWQVRRPSQEGDPRPLLAALERGQPRWMLSTAFETGIGQRWLGHLAALQWRGPTPAAPGLAPGWQGEGGLAAADPAQVWQAAARP